MGRQESTQSYTTLSAPKCNQTPDARKHHRRIDDEVHAYVERGKESPGHELVQ